MYFITAMSRLSHEGTVYKNSNKFLNFQSIHIRFVMLFNFWSDAIVNKSSSFAKQIQILKTSYLRKPSDTLHIVLNVCASVNSLEINYI